MEEETLDKYKDFLENNVDKDFLCNFSALINSRVNLLYIPNKEEKRLKVFFKAYGKAKSRKFYTWDIYDGLVDLISGEKVEGEEEMSPLEILDHIIDYGKKIEGQRVIEDENGDSYNSIIFCLLDYHRYISDEMSPGMERRLKVISELESIITTIVSAPYYTSTPSIENCFTMLDFPYPIYEELKDVLWDASDGVEECIPKIKEVTKENEEVLIKSISGLTVPEAELALSKSLVTKKTWDTKIILEEKREIIKRDGLLEYYEPKFTMDDVGGLFNLVKWLNRRKNCFSDEAKEYGLNYPRGILIVGSPGCGKSLICKAVADLLQMPLLKMDFGNLFGSLVGESEEKARKAFKLAEAVAPSILWVDELEKALSGTKSSGVTDGGTTSRVLGSFLTWMQEKEKPVFIVATANDHEAIPPEFQRAGRFDEVFFVDLPNEQERIDIFKVILRRKNLDPDNFNPKILAGEESQNFSGAEIEKAVENAMIIGFEDQKRKIGNADILQALSEFKPLYEMRKEYFDAMRQWGLKNCVSANGN